MNGNELLLIWIMNFSKNKKKYPRIINLNGSNIFGIMEIRGMCSLSHWGLIMAPVQEANSDNLGESFRFSIQWLYVECNH